MTDKILRKMGNLNFLVPPILLVSILFIFSSAAVAIPKPEITYPQERYYYSTADEKKEVLVTVKIPAENGFNSDSYSIHILITSDTYSGGEPHSPIEATTHIAGSFANHLFDIPHGSWQVQAQLIGPTEGPWSASQLFFVVEPSHVSQKTKPPYVFQPREDSIYYLPAKVPVKVRHYPDPDPYYCLKYFYQISKSPTGPWEDNMKFSGEGAPSVNGIRVGSLHVDEEYYFRLTFRNSEENAQFSPWRHFSTKRDAPGCTTIFQPDGSKILHFSTVNMEIRHFALLTNNGQFNIELGYSEDPKGPYNLVQGAKLENVSTSGSLTTANLELPQTGYYFAKVWFGPPGGIKPDCKAPATYFHYTKIHPIKKNFNSKTSKLDQTIKPTLKSKATKINGILNKKFKTFPSN